MRTILYILPFLILFSCNHKASKEESTNNNLIEISKQQFEAEQMELGEILLMTFPSKLHFTGYIKPSTNGWAKVGLPIEGIVQKIKANVGQAVQKDDPLFVIGGNQFIDLQKEYAESNARLSQLKSDFKRVGLLYEENIGTEKEYITAKSKYESELAMNNALQMKLENIGLNVNRIAQGLLYTSYTITAPIKGYITNMQATIGEYIDQQEAMASIVDPEMLRLQIIAFEKDIMSIKVGQKVEFYSSGKEEELAIATISIVGRTVNTDSKYIECYATIEPEYEGKFINNQFIEGNIILSSDTVQAVPINAVIQADNQSYILSLKQETDTSYLFQKVPLQKGRVSNEHIEVQNYTDINKIVTKGVYNIVVD